MTKNEWKIITFNRTKHNSRIIKYDYNRVIGNSGRIWAKTVSRALKVRDKYFLRTKVSKQKTKHFKIFAWMHSCKKLVIITSTLILIIINYNRVWFNKTRK